MTATPRTSLSAQHIYVSEIDRFKITSRMATLAIAAKATIVLIVSGVTAKTIAPQLHLIRWLAMTICTLQFRVLARQRKLRVLVVIELDALPALRRMAGIAFIAKCAFMLIVFFVTGDTAGRRTLEGRADMAALAGRKRMQARQWKLGFSVIENNFVFPATFVVAFVAAFALLTLMHIVETMTANAGVRQFVMHIAAVTGIAGHIDMLALQHEFGRSVVIKFLLRPRTFVMAGFAALAVFAFMHIIGAMTGNALGF